MSTKNISITLEAYKRLAALKRERESFSDVIDRVTRKSDFENLRKLHGILKGKRGEDLEKGILEGRKLHKNMHQERMKRQEKDWSE